MYLPSHGFELAGGRRPEWPPQPIESLRTRSGLHRRSNIPRSGLHLGRSTKQAKTFLVKILNVTWVLTYLNILAKLLQSRIQKFHELLRGEVLRDVANVELSLGLVVIGKVRLRLLLPVARQYFRRAHHLLVLWLNTRRRAVVEATRKVAFLVSETDLAARSKPVVR